MNLLHKLQDPQLVADCQHYFGVRRLADEPSRTPTKKHYYEKQNGGSEFADYKYCKQREFSAESSCGSGELMDRFLGHSGGGGGKCGRQGTARSRDKTHARQGSSASVNSLGSDGEGGKGKSWMAVLLGENTGGTEGSMDEDNTLSESEAEEPNYTITNRFWYHLFFFSTALGGELFYSLFFCFWAWNVDGAVLRRVIMVWMVTMYIGQALKDLLKVPRPACPPVIRLDTKWELEYGLPSTHAMVGAAMPFSIFILSLSRYQLDWGLGLAIALTWCSCVCVSRIYLGMHSFLDVVCGLVLVSGLLWAMLPWVDTLDHLALTHPASPLITIILTIAMVVCYPATDRWTPARGDTTVIVGVGCGSLLGSWVNYQLGIIREPSLPPPYTVLWPTLNMVGLSLLRTSLGMVVIVAVRAIFKSLSFATICALLQVRTEDYVNKSGSLTSRRRLVVELFYKFITYIAIGFTVVYTGPMTFRLVGIERPTFYTEV
ncbi:sphingosine-1-phosphate phosphatase 2-like [Eriocheir sinensis]|uniref:sphingosine-1-phosphate phosphatase 2-like n=1 Tax=Eriocheir sinensis TaxID=95602 RepID=UPI0021C88BAD|nr:sphingosine-1-phosphate phosphatase 2-like [Eriocheir sinensis]